MALGAEVVWLLPLPVQPLCIVTVLVLLAGQENVLPGFNIVFLVFQGPILAFLVVTWLRLYYHQLWESRPLESCRRSIGDVRKDHPVVLAVLKLVLLEHICHHLEGGGFSLKPF